MDTMIETELLDWMGRQVDEARQVQEAVGRMLPLLTTVAMRMAEVFRQGGQVVFFGNGGSAADAQHWVAELTGGFYRRRASLRAYALTTNPSQVTALANDLGYEEVFAHPLAGMTRRGDMAVGLSTSGRSPNVVRALATAKERGLVTVGFTGPNKAEMAQYSDFLIQMPSDDVARIQEGHGLCGHLICAAVERAVFGDHAD